MDGGDGRRVAVALRFVPYTDDHGVFSVGWTTLIVAVVLVGLGGSFYVVYTLEILKLKRFRMRAAPGAGEDEIEAEIERELETGSFPAVGKGDPAPLEKGPSVP